ncbi:MAG: MFS transporter [Dehalococcoidia bacterium]
MLTQLEMRKGALLVGAATFLFWLSLYFYVPILPLHARDLGATNTMVGAVVAAYAIGQVLLRIPIGVGADIIGRRKPFAVAAFVASGIGALWLALSPSPLSLFFARSVTGIAGAGWVAISVLYASYFSTGRTAGAMSRIMAINGLGLVLATFSGGLIADAIGTLATFYAGLAAAVAGMALLLMAPEPPMENRARYSMTTFITVAKTRLLLMVSAMSVVAHYVTFASTFGFVPMYAEDIGASKAEVGYVTTVVFVTSVAGTLLAPMVVRRLGYASALVIASVIIGGSIAIIPAIGDVASLAGSQAVGGLGRGLLYAMLMTLAVLSVPPAQRATAMGLFQAIYAIGMLIGPVASGAIADGAGIDTVFYVAAAVSVGGSALVVFLRVPDDWGRAPQTAGHRRGG